MTHNEIPLNVFLCHAKDDKPTIEKLYEYLTKSGVDAWLDKYKLIPGQEWQTEIPKAVRNSDVVIVCLSSHSITKEGFIQKEIRFAIDIADEKPDGTIFIIPARLENCEVPERLKKFQWVDLFLDDGYERLAKSLEVRANTLGKVFKFKRNTPTDTENLSKIVVHYKTDISGGVVHLKIDNEAEHKIIDETTEIYVKPGRHLFQAYTDYFYYAGKGMAKIKEHAESEQLNIYIYENQKYDLVCDVSRNYWRVLNPFLKNARIKLSGLDLTEMLVPKNN